MAADTPVPFVPIETPTLALDDEFELGVDSVFVVFCRSIRFFTASNTSLTDTFEPATVILPLPVNAS